MAKGGNKRVGILDLDIFGPSIPTLMGLNNGEEPELTTSKLPGAVHHEELRTGRRRIDPSDESWNPLHVYGFSSPPETRTGIEGYGYSMARSYGTEGDSTAAL